MKLSMKSILKLGVFVSVLLSTYCYSEEDYKAVFLKFESDYMSNDADKLKPWLDKKYKNKRMLTMPGKKVSSKTLSRSKYLRSIKNKNFPSRGLKSSYDTVELELTDANGFCGVSELARSVIIEGGSHQELESREVCFVFVDGKFLAKTHSVTVQYK